MLDKVVVIVSCLISTAVTYPLGSFMIKKILDKKYKKKEEEVIEEYKKNYDALKDKPKPEPKPEPEAVKRTETAQEAQKDAGVNYIIPGSVYGAYANYKHPEASNTSGALKFIPNMTYDAFEEMFNERGFANVQYSYDSVNDTLACEQAMEYFEPADLDILKVVVKSTIQSNHESELYFEWPEKEAMVLVYVD